ncbi:unnamed protein product [Nippostrongylus brasiliensis]|uniref:Microsomal triglyceride transfer protein (inferred by orthology to a C. elegans protein) n=1 Tax=Nippostrongylus brasiliensis TaxID=27835 RepID=A0A158R1E4_NIPBR|nr:unnamed protein product [Nippostrongylus brasiliensis]
MEVPEGVLRSNGEEVERILERLGGTRPRRPKPDEISPNLASPSPLAELDSFLRGAVSEAVREGLDGRRLALAKKRILNRCRQQNTFLTETDVKKELTEEYFRLQRVLWAETKTEPLDEKANTVHKTAPVNDEEKARFIKVDYSFETESVMYDVLENKVKAPSTIIAGNFSFDSLHHDMQGGMLGRYRLTQCKTGNCGDVPDVYVSFVQGGNNIQEVLYDPSSNFSQFPGQEPRWNFMYAMINTIYTPAENGEGDDQYVDTVYGRCFVQFGRPEDKRFRRKISNCELKADVNYTRFGGLQPVKYEQDVHYLQNVKIDADIVVIDAIEILTFGTPFHEKWGFTVESRHVLGNVLGSIGDSKSLKIAREVLFVEGPEFLDDYLLGAAHAASTDEKWHKQLMYWLSEVKNDQTTFWKVANTVATILRRRCDRTTSSKKACRLGKEKIVSKFIDDVSACQAEDCHLKSSYGKARQFLCTATHTSAVQIAALQVIKSANEELYDPKLANTLIKVFRNVCPQPASTGESQLAVDILIRCLPEQQHVATMLLRTETTNPDDHEKWQYFYKAVQSSSRKDELKEEFWRKMRQFKVFRPNYAHRALQANSVADWQEIEAVNHGSRTRFVRERPVNTGRSRGEGPPIGSTELMGAVFNADGQTMKALEGNVMLREASTVLPLLSGLTVEASSNGALSLKILASTEVSLWEQHSKSALDVNISVSMGSEAELLNHGDVVHRLHSNLALITTVGADADVQFSTIPFDFCVTVHRNNAQIRRKTKESTKSVRQKEEAFQHVTGGLVQGFSAQVSVLLPGGGGADDHGGGRLHEGHGRWNWLPATLNPGVISNDLQDQDYFNPTPNKPPDAAPGGVGKSPGAAPTPSPGGGGGKSKMKGAKVGRKGAGGGGGSKLLKIVMMVIVLLIVIVFATMIFALLHAFGMLKLVPMFLPPPGCHIKSS